MNNIFKKFIIVPTILGTMVMTSVGVYAGTNMYGNGTPTVLNESKNLEVFNRSLNNFKYSENNNNGVLNKNTKKAILVNLKHPLYGNQLIERNNKIEKARQEEIRLQKEYEKYVKYQKWLAQKEELKKKEDARRVSASNTTKSIVGGHEVYMPPNAGSFKAWMGYQAVTNTSTLNYHICHTSVTDPNTGIRAKNGRYLVALGPKVAPGVGYEVDIYLTNGKVIHALTGDAKGHTVDGIFQQGHGINSCVEFIVDQSSGSPIYSNGIARMGGAGHLPQFSGYVTKFVVGNKVI